MITNPALVTREAAQRLPRLALWVMMALYLIPGLIGRDPWRNADLTAYSIMLALAEGRIDALAPTIGEVAVQAALPAHALGAAFISVLTPLGVYAPFAARLPFVLLLAATLAMIWVATYHLARTESAQPVAFAFGGQAEPRDYARSLADGAVLAFMATLGVLQLGHETTPEIVQLFSVSMLLWGLATPAQRGWRSGAVTVVALMLLSASGMAELAVGLGLAAAAVSLRSEDPALRPMRGWIAAACAGALAVGWALDTARSDYVWPADATDLWQILRLLGWFAWPTSVLAAWTLWQWRQQITRRHVAVPALLAVLATVQSVAVGGADRALLLAVPGVAVLAAFALPTLSRSASGAIDWFSVFFFGALAVGVWVIYLSFQTGWPPQPLRNALAVAPDYTPVFSLTPLALGIAATLGWLALVVWRGSRQRKPLWKSLVLPACGVLLNWVLAMTLLLHPLDYTRSLTPWVQALREPVGSAQCIAAPEMQLAYVAALEAQGGWRVDARPGAERHSPCDILILTEPRQASGDPEVPGWIFKARVRRPTERHFAALVFSRQPPATNAAPEPSAGAN